MSGGGNQNPSDVMDEITSALGVSHVARSLALVMREQSPESQARAVGGTVLVEEPPRGLMSSQAVRARRFAERLGVDFEPTLEQRIEMLLDEVISV